MNLRDLAKRLIEELHDEWTPNRMYDIAERYLNDAWRAGIREGLDDLSKGEKNELQ